MARLIAIGAVCGLLLQVGGCPETTTAGDPNDPNDSDNPVVIPRIDDVTVGERETFIVDLSSIAGLSLESELTAYGDSFFADLTIERTRPLVWEVLAPSIKDYEEHKFIIELTPVGGARRFLLNATTINRNFEADRTSGWWELGAEDYLGLRFRFDGAGTAVDLSLKEQLLRIPPIVRRITQSSFSGAIAGDGARLQCSVTLFTQRWSDAQSFRADPYIDPSVRQHLPIDQVEEVVRRVGQTESIVGNFSSSNPPVRAIADLFMVDNGIIYVQYGRVSQVDATFIVEADRVGLVGFGEATWPLNPPVGRSSSLIKTAWVEP